jgi:L-iditol 2-dehydrogenase
MKSVVVTEPGKVEICNIRDPEINDYQALVETLACGICGTDKKIIDGHLKGVSHYPVALGHEAVGRVIKVGKKVKSYHVGDLLPKTILVENPAPYYSAWGSFSEYGVAGDYRAMLQDGYGDKEFPETYLVQQRLPESIPPEKSVMVITLKEVWSAIKGFGLKEGSSALIYGAGPVGLSILNVLHLFGVDKIWISEVNAKRLQIARSFRIGRVIDGAHESVGDVIKDHCPEGLDYVIDAVGNETIVNDALKLVKNNGQIVVYGVLPKNYMNLNWDQSPNNWRLLFHQEPIARDEAAAHEPVLSAVEAGQIKLDNLVTHVIDGLDRFMDGYELVSHAEGIKVVIKIRN